MIHPYYLETRIDNILSNWKPENRIERVGDSTLSIVKFPHFIELGVPRNTLLDSYEIYFRGNEDKMVDLLTKGVHRRPTEVEEASYLVHTDSRKYAVLEEIAAAHAVIRATQTVLQSESKHVRLKIQKEDGSYTNEVPNRNSFDYPLRAAYWIILMNQLRSRRERGNDLK